MKDLKDMKKIKAIKFATSADGELLTKVRDACQKNSISLRNAIEYGMEQFLKLLSGKENLK